MSAPIITRALLEHLARYRRITPDKHSDLLSVLRSHDDPGTIYDFGARLGMCAAAEMAIAEAATWEPSNPEIDNDGTEHEVLTNLGRSLLKAAGVDPRRWEEARHG